jgi:hypothetical protein
VLRLERSRYPISGANGGPPLGGQPGRVQLVDEPIHRQKYPVGIDRRPAAVGKSRAGLAETGASELARFAEVSSNAWPSPDGEFAASTSPGPAAARTVRRTARAGFELLRFAPSRTANYVGNTGIEPVTSPV